MSQVLVAGASGALGQALLFGAGERSSNPIDERELALAALEALEGDQAEHAVGGPETLTRRREAELAFEVLEHSARIIAAPRGSRERRRS